MRRWACALAIAAACARARPIPEPPTGGLAGRIVDALTDEPVRGALIAYRAEDGLLRGAVTERDGQFDLGALAPGTHDFTFERYGYRTASAGGVAIEAGRDTLLKVRLTPVDASEANSDFVKIEPPLLLTRVDPKYSDTAWYLGVRGRMVVRCKITVEGRVTHCIVIRDLQYMGAGDVIAALEQRRYRPARRNGEPIEVDYTFRLDFTLSH